MLSDEELWAIEHRRNVVDLFSLNAGPRASIRLLVSADIPHLLADLRRYRDWCRRLVACGALELEELQQEVAAALEGKSC